MKIADYLEMTGITQEALAEACGCWSGTLTDINKGRRFASGNLAFRIEDATGGLVEARTLVKPVGKTGRPVKARDFSKSKS